MENQTKAILIGIAVIGILVVAISSGVIAWTDDGSFRFGNTNSPVAVSVVLLDENGEPISAPLVNSPFYSGEIEVTKLRVSVGIDATGPSTLDWDSININVKIYVIPYVGQEAQPEQSYDSWNLYSSAFTEVSGVYSNIQISEKMLDTLPLAQTSVEGDVVTYNFEIKVVVSGFILDADGTAINADPYTGILGPIVLTQPLSSTQFGFNVDLNNWFP